MSDFSDRFFLDIPSPTGDEWDGNVSPKAWLIDTERTLIKMATSRVGMILLKSMQRSKQWVGLRPPLFGDCNSHGQAGNYIAPGTRRHWMGILVFNARSYEHGNSCFSRNNRGKNNRGFQADEVLFHELIHAHRGALRLRLNDPDGTRLGGGLKRYGFEEEFLAVVITNVFISDETNSNHSGLRRDWSGGHPLESALSNSLGFFQSSPQVLPLLRRFTAQQKELFEERAGVKAAFNPFEAMKNHPVEVEKLSNSRLAKQREIKIPKLAPDPRSNLTPDPAAAFKGLFGALAKEALQVLQ